MTPAARPVRRRPAHGNPGLGATGRADTGIARSAPGGPHAAGRVDEIAALLGAHVDPSGRMRAAGRGAGDPRVRPARCSQAWVPVRGPSPDGAGRGGHRATPSTVEPSPRKSSRSTDCSSAGADEPAPARSASTSAYTAAVASAMRSQP